MLPVPAPAASPFITLQLSCDQAWSEYVFTFVVVLSNIAESRERMVAGGLMISSANHLCAVCCLYSTTNYLNCSATGTCSVEHYSLWLRPSPPLLLYYICNPHSALRTHPSQPGKHCQLMHFLLDSCTCIDCYMYLYQPTHVPISTTISTYIDHYKYIYRPL